jgi:hypothetical protein
MCTNIQNRMSGSVIVQHDIAPPFNATTEVVSAMRICGNTWSAYLDGTSWLNG